MKFAHERRVKLSCSQLTPDKPEQPGLNPPVFIADPFNYAPKPKGEPIKVPSPVSSAIRGDPKQKPSVSTEDIMAFLLKNFGK